MILSDRDCEGEMKRKTDTERDAEVNEAVYYEANENAVGLYRESIRREMLDVVESVYLAEMRDDDMDGCANAHKHWFDRLNEAFIARGWKL